MMMFELEIQAFMVFIGCPIFKFSLPYSDEKDQKSQGHDLGFFQEK